MRLFWSSLLFLFVSNSLLAQLESGLWAGIAAEKEVNKNLEFQFEEQVRLKNNFTDFDKFLIEVGSQFKVNKYYRIGGAYRFSVLENTELGNRLSVYNQLRYKVEDVTFSYKIGFQVDFKTRSPLGYRLRNKLGMDYKINKKWSIGVSSELFYSITYKRNYFNNIRVNGGIDYKINKHNKLSCALIYNQEINEAAPGKELILSLGYKHSF